MFSLVVIFLQFNYLEISCVGTVNVNNQDGALITISYIFISCLEILEILKICSWGKCFYIRITSQFPLSGGVFNLYFLAS